MFPRLSRKAPELKPFRIDPAKPVILREFGAEGPAAYSAPPTAFDYKPPSMLRRHGLIALLFVLLCAAVIVGLVKAFHHPRPPPAEPVYIESVGGAG